MAEVIAAVAVIISLIYVGRELQSNTAAIRASSLQSVSNASADILLSTATDSALSRIRQIGDEDLSGLTDAEAYRYHTLIRQVWLTLQNVYFQNELEVIDPRVWSGYARIICDAWSHPSTPDTWPIHRHTLDSGFAEFVEQCSSQ